LVADKHGLIYLQNRERKTEWHRYTSPQLYRDEVDECKCYISKIWQKQRTGSAADAAHSREQALRSWLGCDYEDLHIAGDTLSEALRQVPLSQCQPVGPEPTYLVDEHDIYPGLMWDPAALSQMSAEIAGMVDFSGFQALANGGHATASRPTQAGAYLLL
jgi:hypothetical protein